MLVLSQDRAGHPDLDGGLWLRMILPAGLRAWLVPSGVYGQLPAELVQQDVVVPVAAALEIEQAGGAAVGALDDMVR